MTFWAVLGLFLVPGLEPEHSFGWLELALSMGSGDGRHRSHWLR